MQTTLAFDTATSAGAVCALASGERARRATASQVLAAIDEIVDDPRQIDRLVVGLGPGSFTSIRIGLATALSLVETLGIELKGASTLDAFAGGMPVLDARRGEVFAPGPRVCAPEELEVDGLTLVGDGAVRYRDIFEQRGATIPPDDNAAHVPDPLLLIERATSALDLLYVRQPDAKPSA